ncbi:hypothetical protein, partial [Pseudomonas sp. MPR-AND1A]|uniref:hypothetical protein n=1 Tax=Pseudomonas sp. MPR-AND1A TaxID=2070600 RepID=UPI001C4643F5
MIAGSVLFAPENVGAAVPNRKLYRETYFTDPRTAQSLRQLTISPIAAQFPDSQVTGETEIHADINLFDAARASTWPRP